MAILQGYIIYLIIISKAHQAIMYRLYSIILVVELTKVLSVKMVIVASIESYMDLLSYFVAMIRG